MITNNIPTAEELMNSKNGEDYTHYEEIADLMRKFADLHVRAALEAFSKNYKIIMTVDKNFIVDPESIMNAYPISNIK
jgi:hypothetical protein